MWLYLSLTFLPLIVISTDCSPGLFQCDNGVCIPQRFRCDDSYECPDGTDETNCPGKSLAKIKLSQKICLFFKEKRVKRVCRCFLFFSGFQYVCFKTLRYSLSALLCVTICLVKFEYGKTPHHIVKMLNINAPIPSQCIEVTFYHNIFSFAIKTLRDTFVVLNYLGIGIRFEGQD